MGERRISRLSETAGPRLAALLVGLILFGDVYLVKITVPAAMLLLPLLAFIYPPWDLLRLRNVPSGAYILAAVLALVPVQATLYAGPALRWRSDLAVWLPLFWAVAAMLALRSARLSDALLWKALLAGGIVTGLIMLAIAALAPPGWYPVPGQAAAPTEQAYERSLVAENAAGSAAGPTSGRASIQTPLGEQAFQPVEPTQAEQRLYQDKYRIVNFLGRSNYIAVFLVFLFEVALFQRSRVVAVIFALLAAATLSRGGLLFLAVGFGFWVAARLRIGAAKWALVVPFLALLVPPAVALLSGWLGPQQLPSSLESRLSYWQSGWRVALEHPVLGLPRSILLIRHNYGITWNPHNPLLWIVATFGIVGLGLYFAYLTVALRAIARRAVGSDLWRGIYVGLLLMLAWGTFEIVWWTPAFEILLASLYILARNGMPARTTKDAASG